MFIVIDSEGQVSYSKMYKLQFSRLGQTKEPSKSVWGRVQGVVSRPLPEVKRKPKAPVKASMIERLLPVSPLW
ncbi:MAG: hypothetical protein AMK71_03935 [Nitrospira bacterium SG8_35_4]|nr:MAG: hypothetical protein AMK71_03935 [Nitrospira bacterium SG8_35_4]